MRGDRTGSPQHQFKIDIVANAVDRAADRKDFGGVIFRFAASARPARSQELPDPLAQFDTMTRGQIHSQQNQQALHDQLRLGCDPAKIKNVGDRPDQQPTDHGGKWRPDSTKQRRTANHSGGNGI